MMHRELHNDASRTSSSVTVYVGTPELTTIAVSPASTTVKAGLSKQFIATGLDQFGQAFPANVSWSVSGGGLIDASGLFTAVVPGGPYTVTATDTAGVILSDTSSVTVEDSGTCSGDHPNGEFSWEASGDATNPTLTFIPSIPGAGNTVLLLYYGRIPDGGFPGYFAAPNVPFQINAAEGETIYFYYTYSVPGSGEHNTLNDKLSFVVGDCLAADTIVPVPNPLTWSVLPYSTGDASISMTATTALDASGVEYYFANLTDPAHDSGWQTDSVYNDVGLSADTSYSYTVTARDLSVNHNQGGVSTSESATTTNSAADTDGDLIVDSSDNCVLVTNPAQIDTDGDGHGNMCDGDFDQDCSVTFLDLSIFKAGFFGDDANLDLDSSGSVNFSDLAIMKTMFFTPPGPSAAGLCP